MRGAGFGAASLGEGMEPWNMPGPTMGGVYGPQAGAASMEAVSTVHRDLAGVRFSSPTKVLSLPALLLLAGLAWYALKTYQ